MPPTREAWAAAYARQSQSDFEIYQRLTSAGVADCHRWHYLQMACEKIAKAYRFRESTVPTEKLMTSHKAFSTIITTLMKADKIKARYPGQTAKYEIILRYARSMAREIEKLAPAIDRDASPQNAEYPWEDRGQIVVPCDYAYPNMQSLTGQRGQDFLHLLTDLITDFDRMSF